MERDVPSCLVLQAWGDEMGVFYLEGTWSRLMAVENALRTSRTWGDFERLLPPGEFEALTEWEANDGTSVYNVDGETRYAAGDGVRRVEGRDDLRILEPATPFSAASISGYEEGDYPPWVPESFEGLPGPFVDAFGDHTGSFVSGRWTEYSLAREAEMADELRKHGFSFRVERAPL